ncbi:hypothetical protein [Chloroflexus sp.]|uniref:hypothetical protein n=1 Tax=Chloroflexus sp. TaxID=1904827 RepID=UPI002ACDE812|nr:hypothetical protein [Chloroflexus sp.]
MAPLLDAVEAALQQLRAVTADPTRCVPDGWWRADPAAMHLLERVQQIVALVADRGGLENAPGCFVERHPEYND